MHVYIYEAKLENSKYHPILAKIETRLTDLGLNGKIVRLNPMHNLERTIRDEAKGDKTLVLVGGDELINSTITFLSQQELPVGIIPIGKDNNTIATSLGIEPEILACDTLAARRILSYDLGLANNAVFINQLTIKSDHALIDVKDNLSLEISSKADIQITNLPGLQAAPDSSSQPDDALLELTVEILQKKSLFSKSNASHSYIQNDNFLINGNFECVADNCKKIDAPVQVGLLPKAIRLIVGKRRLAT